MNIFTWDSIGYSDLVCVSLARIQGKNSVGPALNLSAILVFVTTIVAADARKLLEGANNISVPQVNFIHRSKN